jgi:3-keto-5-aminohexanoate cleavage enzyme
MAEIMLQSGVKPEIEIFDAGHIDIAKRFIDKGLVKKPVHFQFCMGVMGGISASPKNLFHLVESIPSGSTWSVLGIGPAEFPMIGMAMLLGGQARVGFEDNIYIEKGILAESNAQLVKKAARMAHVLGREIATANEAREILGLKEK